MARLSVFVWFGSFRGGKRVVGRKTRGVGRGVGRGQDLNGLMGLVTILY